MARNRGELKAFLDSNKPEREYSIKRAGERGLSVFPGENNGWAYTIHLLNVLGVPSRKRNYLDYNQDQFAEAMRSLYLRYEEDILGYLTEERVKEIHKKLEDSPPYQRQWYGPTSEQAVQAIMAAEVIRDWCRGIDISATAVLCELRDWGEHGIQNHAREKDDNYTPTTDILTRFIADNKNKLLDYATTLSEGDICILRRQIEDLRRKIRLEHREIELTLGASLLLLETVASYLDALSKDAPDTPEP